MSPASPKWELTYFPMHPLLSWWRNPQTTPEVIPCRRCCGVFPGSKGSVRGFLAVPAVWPRLSLYRARARSLCPGSVCGEMSCAGWEVRPQSRWPGRLRVPPPLDVPWLSWVSSLGSLGWWTLFREGLGPLLVPSKLLYALTFTQVSISFTSRQAWPRTGCVFTKC